MFLPQALGSCWSAAGFSSGAARRRSGDHPEPPAIVASEPAYWGGGQWSSAWTVSDTSASAGGGSQTGAEDSPSSLRQLGECSCEEPSTGVEECSFGRWHVEPDGVYERDHGFGADDKSQCVGDAVEVLLGQLGL
jgi:hypothetical protein